MATIFSLSALKCLFYTFCFNKLESVSFISESVDFLTYADVICFLMNDDRTSLSMDN